VLLERVNIHPRPIFRHRFDDNGTDEFQQAFLTIIFLIPIVVTMLLLAALPFLPLFPPSLPFRIAFLLFGLFFRSSSSLYECAVFRLFLRSCSRSDDRGSLGLCALESRKARRLLH
jgi:hypothetical protein